MKSKKDSEAKEWVTPLTGNDDLKSQVINKCVGKNVADCVESSICALYLTTGCLKTVLRWISDIQLVPLKETTMIDLITEGTDNTFGLYKPLDVYCLDINDFCIDLFQKYFHVEKEVNETFKTMMISKILQTKKEVGELG